MNHQHKQFCQYHQKMFNRSRRRNKFKSPLKIRDKIRQLEEKVEKKHFQNPTSLDKKSPKCRQKIDNRANFKHTVEQRNQFIHKTNNQGHMAHHDKPRSSMRKVNRQSSDPKLPSKYQNNHLNKSKSFNFLKQAQNNINNETKSCNEQQQKLNYLKQENLKIKKIYNDSLEKMHQLEGRLKEIKLKHQNEDWNLKGAIMNLKQKIEAKKINICHIYTYDKDNHKGKYLTIDDVIITQTENENSSSNVENTEKRHFKSPQFSQLSIQSK